MQSPCQARRANYLIYRLFQGGPLSDFLGLTVGTAPRKAQGMDCGAQGMDCGAQRAGRSVRAQGMDCGAQGMDCGAQGIGRRARAQPGAA